MIGRLEPRKRTSGDRPSSMRHILSDGTEKRYSFKLFHVQKESGATTCSMAWEDYSRTCARFKTNVAGVSTAVRCAANLLYSRGHVTGRGKLSPLVVAKAKHILEAAQLGVTLEEFEHSLANNSNWVA